MMGDHHMLERISCKVVSSPSSVNVAYQVQLPQDAAISLGETTFRHRQLMALTKGNYCAHISPTLGPSRSERAPLTLGSFDLGER